MNYSPNKPARYYVCCDSEKQREDVQDTMKNIEGKTHKSYGQNLLDAVTYYNDFLNSKRGR